jgi:hypothetical protein
MMSTFYTMSGASPPKREQAAPTAPRPEFKKYFPSNTPRSKTTPTPRPKRKTA